MAFSFLKSVTPFFMDNIGYRFGFYTDKNQILDPITTAIRISLLAYKPLYTKINISDNRIYFQEPMVLIQGIRRNFNGDTGTDIHIMINSIKNLLLWYKRSDKRIRYIFDGVISGLEKLSQGYRNIDKKYVSETIDLFIDKIKSELGDLHDSIDDNTDTESIHSNTDVESLLSDKLIENDIYYDYFKKHWNVREIMIIYNQLKELEIDENQKKRESIIQSIDNLLTYKDEETNKYITSLTKY